MTALWTARLENYALEMTAEELAAFRACILDPELSNRVSDLLLFEMCVLKYANGIEPFEIMDTIQNLEKGEKKNGVKASCKFMKPPLRGLWHKHYFTGNFLAHNVLKDFENGKMKSLIKRILRNSPSATPDELAEKIARVTATGPIEQRAREGKLTGEWVVFAKNKGQNYYLSLCRHDEGDAVIFDKITEHCRGNFPDLALWIAAEAAAG